MWRSRTLASQILVAVLSILVITVALGAVLYVRYSASTLDNQYEQRALGIANAVSAMPDVRSALAAGDPQHVIRSLAAGVERSTNASYVVVIDRNGLRYSHPNPALIGQRIEEPVVALDGHTHVTTDHGSLGLSANGKAPIRGTDNAVIGEVSVGISEQRISTQLHREVLAIVLYSVAALALGMGASLLLARRLKRVTFGLEPAEIAELLQEREAMLHGIREGVIGFDARDRLIMANDEALRLLGIPPGAQGKQLDELVPAGRLNDLLSGRVDGNDHLVLTDDYLLILNRRPVTVRGRAAGSVVTLRDRTELESLVRELDTVNGLTAALRAQEHEFSNRLHVITGLLDLGETSEATRYVAEISTASMAHAEELRSRISPPAIAALLLAKVTVGAERGIDLVVTPNSRLDQPQSMTRTLLTVIGNLLDNAFDAFDAFDGSGTLDALDGSAEPRRVTIHICDQGGEIRISVSDTGPGVAPELREQIFHDGFSTKSARGKIGRGLGLALVHRLVLRAGGEIAVGPPPGGHFDVRIPVIAAGDAKPAHVDAELADRTAPATVGKLTP